MAQQLTCRDLVEEWNLMHAHPLKAGWFPKVLAMSNGKPFGPCDFYGYEPVEGKSFARHSFPLASGY